jgi:hypothetical protein
LRRRVLLSCSTRRPEESGTLSPPGS